MADIQLRFNKDMLVLSTPIATQLERAGAETVADQAYALLFEPEVMAELYKLDFMTGAQCVVADTSALTRAQLARIGMEKDAQALAANAVEIAAEVKPQHLLIELSPCGLPLDASSKSSLVENRDQYTQFAKLFADAEFDAFFLDGFSRVADIKCALMGIRKVSDKPIIASVCVDEDGMLAKGPALRNACDLEASDASGRAPAIQESIEEAVCAMCDLGADMVGFCAAVAPLDAAAFAARVHAVCDAPVLVQLYVRDVVQDQTVPTLENPYFEPDTMVDAAEILRGAGVQFLRAVGQATPAYTGALVATTDKLDVVGSVASGQGDAEDQPELDDLAAKLRAKVASALGK